MTLDPAMGRFYSLGTGNSLQANALTNGELQFTVPLGYNEAFAWPLLHRSGKRLIAAGTEQKMFSPRGVPPTQSLIQIIEDGSPAQLSPYKVLLSVDAQEDLLFNNPTMLPVAAGDMIWAVLPNLIVRTSASQEIAGAWSDTFEPVYASADEAGWLHLVAAVGERRELWIVRPEGRRTVRTDLKVENRAVSGPPAIGYDHRVYLWTSQLVAAFSPEGRHLWDCVLAGPIAGLSVTPDDHLVVAAGERVYVIDQTGKALPLLEIGEPVTAAPVVTAEGDIIVGTGTRVLCFNAVK